MRTIAKAAAHSRTAPALTGFGLLAAVALAGCGDELGACDREAAEEVVFGRNALVATKGQALIHDSCGNAAFCHSAAAEGEQRRGAPSGLDFDMLPAPTGWPQIAEHRDAIWSAVVDGAMPPEGAGARTLGDNDWTFDVDHREGAERLPPLSTREGKAAVRNWLACGAPVVAETRVPSWALPPADAGTGFSDWSEIFAQVIEPSCSIAGCHNGPNAGGLVMIEECEAYAQLLKPSMCRGMPRLTPGDGASYLLDKLESEMPTCNGRMPPLGPLPEAVLSDLRGWVEAGAPAAGCGSP